MLLLKWKYHIKKQNFYYNCELYFNTNLQIKCKIVINMIFNIIYFNIIQKCIF